MTQYSQERTNAREYRDLGSQPGGMFEAAMEDSSGRAAFNALLSGQSGSLPDCLVASPKEFLVKSNHEAQTMQGFHLDILSASTYPDLLSAPDANTRRQGRRHTQPSTFGGYEMLEDIDDSSGHMAHDRPDAEKPAKKRVKRASRSDDDDNIKKQRGRPRLDTRDKTAADRRRTQIRLAQRAYRQRKETTITALKKRVSELEGAIDDMNSSFLTFNDNAINSGLLRTKPELAQQLRRTTEHFLDLAKYAAPVSDHDEEAMEDIVRESSAGGLSRHGVSNRGALPLGEKKHDSRMDPPLGYEVSFGEAEDSPNGPAREFSTDHETVQPHQQDWKIANTYHQFNVQFPDPTDSSDPATLPIERLPKPSSPYTYSFQETTFARRLHRACLERGSRLLGSPSSDRDEIERAFRFTFCFSNKERMQLRFQELLKRGNGESLENWKAPFFQVGGAGSHFPGLDERGQPMYPPNMYSPARAIGPSPFVLAETPRNEKSVDQILGATGFDGEWFDSRDVEQYLRSLGIKLDGNSSFIEVDPAVTTGPPLTGHVSAVSDSESSSDSRESPMRTPPATAWERSSHAQNALNEEYATLGRMEPTYTTEGFFPLQDKLSTFGTSQGFTMPGNGTFPATEPGFSMSLQAGTVTPITVDVQKLLDKMVNSSVCLGRAPGFRRKDIDTAINIALQEAF